MNTKMNKENMEITETEALNQVAGGDNGAARTDIDPESPKYSIGKYVDVYTDPTHFLFFEGQILDIKYDYHLDNHGNTFKCNLYYVKSDMFSGILDSLNTEGWYSADAIVNNGQ